MWKKVAYAASFGTDKDYITQEKIPVCVDLIKRFDAISVREKSAVKICDERFEVKAEHVLDPTMLLSSEDYKNLFKFSVFCLDISSIRSYVIKLSKCKVL